ncbi:helix-turn-helix domain-containing protein [Priestia sp. Y58]|uniref:helix-turn-helix domain-containing protein n=1 Tax=Priestia TaxID=2800373 RepID=UPI002404C093|nr:MULTISPECIES: helix-turn-helix domain-containing protein [Priestia]MDG0029079.1 helix-turn-helix domain-containing protein [Priestia sp. Y58]MDG0059156.1 helix-turn-helix domain-containing protein [Priestia sp. P5]MDN4862790.1 helix-turn-helix domain-containing protein [Priestia megaterium]
MDKQTISVKEAADYMGVSKDLVYQLVREGKVPHLRLSRRILFRKEALNKWLTTKETLSVQQNDKNY